MNDLIKTINKDFRFTDNVVENPTMRDAICDEGKASLIIEGNISSSNFSRMLSNSTSLSYEGFELPEKERPITLEFSNNAERYELKCNYVIFHSEKYLEHDKDLSNVRAYPNCNCKIYKNGEFYRYYCPDFHTWSKEDLCKAVLYTYGSTFNICKAIGLVSTTKQVAVMFGQTPHTFGKLSKIPNMVINEWLAPEKLCNIDHGEIQPLLLDYEATSIPFRGAYGQVYFYMLTAYNFAKGYKIFVPVTVWQRDSQRKPLLFCVPYPKEQPLYGLELLSNPKVDTVILTDSVELAYKNQQLATSNVAWISFCCNDYSLIDWSPIKELNVYLLITNHSGLSLQEAYLKQNMLSEYLQNEVQIDLNYLQVKVQYNHRISQPSSLEELNTQKVVLLPDYTQKLSYDEFIKKVAEAQDSIRLSANFGTLPQCSEPISSHIDNAEVALYEYLVRPFILKASVTFIHAPKSCGKSSFAYSLCATITAAKNRTELCEGMHWISPVPSLKVLYIDMENSPAVISTKFKSFCYPIWGQDLKKREEAKKNFIVKNKQDISFMNYADKANHHHILKWLEEAKQTDGKDVNLLVIDTLTEFTAAEDSSKVTAGLLELCKKINDQGTAVLIVHHTGASGEMRGLKSKKDNASISVKLSRQAGGPEESLYDSTTLVEWENLRNPDYCHPQKIKFTKSGWQAVLPENSDMEDFSKTTFKNIVKNYKVLGFKDTEIQQILKMSNGGFYGKLK